MSGHFGELADIHTLQRSKRNVTGAAVTLLGRWLIPFYEVGVTRVVENLRIVGIIEGNTAKLLESGDRHALFGSGH